MMQQRVLPVMVWVIVASVWMASVAGLVAAEPPVLSGLVVLPDTLEVGTGEQTVNISVRVSDPDDDLKKVKVKQIREGEKNKTLAVLVDDGSNGDAAAGDGRFTANVTFSTNKAKVIQLLIKVKDQAKEKAKLKTTLSVTPSAPTIQTGTFIKALAIDPGTPSTLYAEGGSGVFKSLDGGGTWTNIGLTSGIVAIDPRTPSTVYVGGSGVFKSLDGGETWTAVNTGLPASNVEVFTDLRPFTDFDVEFGGGGVFRTGTP